MLTIDTAASSHVDKNADYRYRQNADCRPVRGYPSTSTPFPTRPGPGPNRDHAGATSSLAVMPDFRDFKDTVYPFFESDTLFLECCVVLCLVV